MDRLERNQQIKNMDRTERIVEIINQLSKSVTQSVKQEHLQVSRVT